MTNIERIDDDLYKVRYILSKVDEYKNIWDEIKKSPEVLREAVKIKKDKFNEHDIVTGLAIAEAMLVDYKNVDEVAYTNLINSIYTNTDIARLVIDGAANGGYSFLLMSLWNHNLKLTEEQKAFAVDEAMNKVGTVRWKEKEAQFLKKLDDNGISDDETTYVDFDGSINPMGARTASRYVNYMFSVMSDTQAHGIGEYDIRYCILKNPNWTLEEKQKLVMDFWWDDEEYDECLEQWEWGIVNDEVNYCDGGHSFVPKSELYYCTYEQLLTFYGDKYTTDTIWNEIQFCKQMHKLRPQQWEIETKIQPKVLKK